MKRTIRKTVIFVALVATTAWISWWVYKEGHLGIGPYAPTQKNFKFVVEAWAQRNGELGAYCIRPGDERQGGSPQKKVHLGETALDSPIVPGLWSMTVEKQTSNAGPDQARKDRANKLLGALVKAGFMKADDAEPFVSDNDNAWGTAQTFSITTKGWEATADQDNSGCFVSARRKILAISRIARVTPDPKGLRAYEVTYKIGATELEKWLTAAGAENDYPDLREQLDPAERKVTLLRTRGGWIPAPLLKDKDAIDDSKLRATMDNLLPALTPERVTSLVAQHPELKRVKACALLPKDASFDADRIEFEPGQRFSALFYQRNSSHSAFQTGKEIWQSRLEAMAENAIFRVEPVSSTVAGYSPIGLRYVLSDSYLKHVSKEDSACLQLGETRIEVLPGSISISEWRHGIEGRFLALAHVDNGAWSRAIGWSGISEARAYLDVGVPIVGRLVPRNGAWEIARVDIVRPKIPRESRQLRTAGVPPNPPSATSAQQSYVAERQSPRPAGAAPAAPAPPPSGPASPTVPPGLPGQAVQPSKIAKCVSADGKISYSDKPCNNQR